MRHRVHCLHHLRGSPHLPPHNFIDGETDVEPASEKCHQEKRKTVNGEDIIFAMTSLGFENYAEVLKIYLAKYRAVCSLHPTQILRIKSLIDVKSNKEGGGPGSTGNPPKRKGSGFEEDSIDEEEEGAE